MSLGPYEQFIDLVGSGREERGHIEDSNLQASGDSAVYTKAFGESFLN